MALDFKAINPRSPGLETAETRHLVAGIPLQAHEHLLRMATENKLTLLSRLADYWSDARYEHHELEAVQLELETVRRLLSPNDADAVRLDELFTKMLLVVSSARQRGGHVEAIAD